MTKLKTHELVKIIEKTTKSIDKELKLLNNPKIGLHNKKQSIDRIRFFVKYLVTDIVDLSNMKFL